MENNKLVYDFYEHFYNEDEREICQPLEFIRTKEIISRYLTGNKMKIATLRAQQAYILIGSPCKATRCICSTCQKGILNRQSIMGKNIILN